LLFGHYQTLAAASVAALGGLVVELVDVVAVVGSEPWTAVVVVVGFVAGDVVVAAVATVGEAVETVGVAAATVGEAVETVGVAAVVVVVGAVAADGGSIVD